MNGVPDARIRLLVERPAHPEGRFVLYWMLTARRLHSNFGLDRAVYWAEQLGRPLVIFEELRHDYAWASPRMHRFALDGMREHAECLRAGPVTYLPYVEPHPGAREGLLEALAAHACVVVSDDYPVWDVPQLLSAASQRVGVRFEAVDSNGLLPMRSACRDFTAAVHFRRHLHKELSPHLVRFPHPDPLASAELVAGDAGLLLGDGNLALQLAERWPMATREMLDADAAQLAQLRLAHDVAPVSCTGGHEAARQRLERFMTDGLDRYADERNHPDSDAASGLSPYLHWGHLGAHEVFERLAARERWSPARLSVEVTARREGWWGMSPTAEAFLDEFVTWREIGFNFAVEHPDDFDAWQQLPAWAIQTLEEHADDPREHLYTFDELDEARTGDRIWNAAQRQLRREGIIHNYLRMLWGKRILEWTRHPREALDIMIELNNRYALDGCDPNSYSGIFWVLGRFDRAWKERPIYGKVRYMSSEATRRKVKMESYLKRFSAAAEAAERRAGGL